jgi:hypothetical protein
MITKEDIEKAVKHPIKDSVGISVWTCVLNSTEVSDVIFASKTVKDSVWECVWDSFRMSVARELKERTL